MCECVKEFDWGEQVRVTCGGTGCRGEWDAKAISVLRARVVGVVVVVRMYSPLTINSYGSDSTGEIQDV